MKDEIELLSRVFEKLTTFFMLLQLSTCCLCFLCHSHSCCGNSLQCVFVIWKELTWKLWATFPVLFTLFWEVISWIARAHLELVFLLSQACWGAGNKVRITIPGFPICILLPMLSFSLGAYWSFIIWMKCLFESTVFKNRLYFFLLKYY